MPASITSQRTKLRLPHFQVETEQHLVEVGHVADQALQGERQPLDERGHGDNLFVARQLRMFADVDDLEPVPSAQILLAHAGNVLDRDLRLERRPADVEAQQIFVLTGTFLHRTSFSARPTSTLSVSERSPMICRTAWGSFTTRAGTATI